jgi:hypothetical protein
MSAEESVIPLNESQLYTSLVVNLLDPDNLHLNLSLSNDKEILPTILHNELNSSKRTPVNSLLNFKSCPADITTVNTKINGSSQS